jgi:Cytochrome C biogenesis protein transmembrane region
MSDLGVVDIATSAAPAHERRASGSAIHARQLLGALAATLVGATAVSAAVLTGPTIGSINSGVEVVSSASTSLMGGLADALPVGYAFGAGMVAALNPCGFALLPAYIGLYLGTIQRRSGPRRFLRAFEVSAAMTAGFIVLFGSAGVVLALATSSIARYFPWACCIEVCPSDPDTFVLELERAKRGVCLGVLLGGLAVDLEELEVHLARGDGLVLRIDQANREAIATERQLGTG